MGQKSPENTVKLSDTDEILGEPWAAPDYCLVKCRCTSQFCPDCALSHAVSWREKLRPAMKDWKDVTMITLTVNQSNFESPQQAWEHLQKKRAIAELIRKLGRRGTVKRGPNRGAVVPIRCKKTIRGGFGIKKILHSDRWLYCLEFHKRGGWPHYHVLVESGFIDKHLVQELWAEGHVWISRTRGFENTDHAINYATKYLVKDQAKDGGFPAFPDWVMEYEGNIRRFSTSRGMCGDVVSRKANAGESGRTRKVRKIKERLEKCGKSTAVLRIESNGRRSFVRTVDAEWSEDFKKMSREDLLEFVAANVIPTLLSPDFWSKGERLDLLGFLDYRSDMSHLPKGQQRVLLRLRRATRLSLIEQLTAIGSGDMRPIERKVFEGRPVELQLLFDWLESTRSQS